jgi:DNA polymerase
MPRKPTTRRVRRLPGKRAAQGSDDSSPSQATPLLENLREESADCKRCDLWRRATQTVFGEGTSPALLMLVGEQPGDAEDVAGRPFVGPAGKLLRAAMAQAGIPADVCYVTNAVKHFKWVDRGGRRIHERPRSGEVLACRQWLDGEIAAVKPTLILALGVTAAQSVFGRSVRIIRDRGRVIAARTGTPAMVTAHPSSVLRAPDSAGRAAARSQLVADLKQAYEEATRLVKGRRR